jgi:hypothetical protein
MSVPIGFVGQVFFPINDKVILDIGCFGARGHVWDRAFEQPVTKLRFRNFTGCKPLGYRRCQAKGMKHNDVALPWAINRAATNRKRKCCVKDLG